MPFISSYSQTNKDTALAISDATNNSTGQSFPCVGSSTLMFVEFFLQKVATPAGTIVAKVYAHSGTYGTSSIPTGAALATSDAVTATTLSTTFGMITFTFSGANQIKLTNDYYVVVLEYSAGTGINFINYGADSSAPTHSGNGSTFNGTIWTAQSFDLCFSVTGVKNGLSINIVRPRVFAPGLAR